jgi:hypothetical protein
MLDTRFDGLLLTHQTALPDIFHVEATITVIAYHDKALDRPARLVFNEVSRPVVPS